MLVISMMGSDERHPSRWPRTWGIWGAGAINYDSSLAADHRYHSLVTRQCSLNCHNYILTSYWSAVRGKESDSEFQPEIWIRCMINDLMPDVTWWQYNQCSVRICHKMRCHYFLWLSIESCQVSEPAPSYPEYHNFTLNYWHLCIVIIGGTPGAGWGHKYSLYFA